jgi:hypothetical protein
MGSNCSDLALDGRQPEPAGMRISMDLHGSTMKNGGLIKETMAIDFSKNIKTNKHHICWQL